MSADRQLANEIEFDLRKFEEQQEEMERQRLEQLRRRSRGAPVRAFFLNFGGHKYFYGAPDTPYFGLLVTSPLGFNARVGSLICRDM